MTWRIGVDSGGTFTDVCLFDDETGKVEIWKVSSTPDDPSRGITQGVVEGLEQVGADASELGFLGHGTTVATNALIELRGVKTGLIVSDGFRDLLEIGRQKRPNLYDMFAEVLGGETMPTGMLQALSCAAARLAGWHDAPDYACFFQEPALHVFRFRHSRGPYQRNAVDGWPLAKDSLHRFHDVDRLPGDCRRKYSVCHWT